MSEHDCLVRNDENDVRTLRISRPHARNALNRELLRALSNELDALAENASLRALVVTGDGDAAFCAGADLKERKDMSLEETHEFVVAIGKLFRKLELIEIPTIAALNGSAFGGGLELALACDFRIAAAHAKMGLTECKLGIMPGAGGTQRLPRLIAPSRAKNMIFTGAVIDSDRALEIGLVDSVGADSADLGRQVGELTNALKSCAPLSIRASKRAMRSVCEVDMEKGLALEFQAYESLIGTQDRVEGLKAFAQKRSPQFAGR